MRRRLARRAQLVRARSRAKNEIHAVLMRCLKDRPPAVGPVRRQGPGVAGRAAAAGLRARDRRRRPAPGRLPRHARSPQVEQLIAADALGWPEVKRLMTVPGVNVIVAATFMAAVGDIRRFPDRRKLTAYLGLDPRVRQSGAAPANHGHISKQGSSSARHALVEACWSTVRQPGPIAALLRAHQSPARPLDRDRRLGAQARLPVLVPAHPRRGLRVRPALADDQEDAPPRAHRRRPAPPRRPRRLVDQHRDAQRRTRTRPPSPARLRTHRRRLASRSKGGRERDTGARITTALEGPSRAADHKPLTSALRYVSHSRPPRTDRDRRSRPTSRLDFHPSSSSIVSGASVEHR